MVQTRSGFALEPNSSKASRASLLVVSTIIALLALTGLYVVFENVEDKAHSILQRSSYSFGGTQGKGSHYWDQIPSWDEIKNQATHTQVLPDPTMWEQVKSLVTRKPVRQIQAESAYAAGKQTADEYAQAGQQAAQKTKEAASDAAQRTKQAASDAASTTQDFAQHTAQATQDKYKSAKDVAASIPERVRSTLFGIKTAAEKEASRQRRIAQEAQWRAEYGSHQGWLAKLKHILFGPAKLPSTQQYDDAAAAGSSAYTHSVNAGNEAYLAAKDAAEGIVAGGRGAARSAAGAAASVADTGSRAAGSVSDSASSAYNSEAADTAAEYARQAKEKASAAYSAAADTAQRAKGAARGVHSEL